MKGVRNAEKREVGRKEKNVGLQNCGAFNLPGCSLASR